MAQREEAGESESQTSFVSKATDKSCCGAQFFWEIPGEPRETVSIPTEASTSTLWIERECVAVAVVFLFVGFQSFHLHMYCFNLAQENKSSISLPHFHLVLALTLALDPADFHGRRTMSRRA